MSAVDPFLAELAQTMHQSHAEQKQGGQPLLQNVADAADADMEDEVASASSPPAAASASAARGLPFLQQHIEQYQKRIESVLSYLHEYRYGRVSASTQSIQRLQKSVAELQEDVRSLESEWSTWLLLAELRRADETAGEQAVPPALAERYSLQLLTHRLASTPSSQPGSLARVLRILNWLEELQVLLLRVEESGEVSFRRSLRRLQQSMSPDPQQDWLDPDVELRLKQAGVLVPSAHVLERGDLEEEERLLTYVWALLRAGRGAEAVQLCRTFQQHWRAASLQGGEKWHDEGEIQTDGSVYRVGNPTRLLWRHTCRALSQAPGVSPVESSIYGLLGGHLPGALSYSGQYKYEDALFVYLKLMVDAIVEDFLQQEAPSRMEAEGADKKEASIVPRDLASVLAALESPLNNLLSHSVRNTAQNDPYVRLHKYLMLDQIEQVEAEMVHTIQTQYKQTGAVPSTDAAASPSSSSSTVNHTYLLFCVHLYLYLHPACPTSEPLNEAGKYLLRAYLSYLSAHPAQHSLIASYVQYLSPADRVEWYVSFLARIPSLEARQELLETFAQYCPDQRLEVTRNLLNNILHEEREEKTMAGKQLQPLLLTTGKENGTVAAAAPSPSPFLSPLGGGAPATAVPTSFTPSVPNLLSGDGGHISDLELEQITSIDCFAVVDGHTGAIQPAVVQAGLVQATSLYRHLVARGRVAAAKRFAEHMATQRWDQHVFAVLQWQQTNGVEPSPEWLALDREYSQWKEWIKAVNWYSAWITHQDTEPAKPSFNPSAYTHAATAQAEYKVFASKYARYETEHKVWKETQRKTVQECAEAFLSLLQVEGGWMTPLEGSLNPSELHSLRRLCIPHLVSLLMQIATTSNEQQLCLEVADVLASPLHNLHTCFTPEQMRGLLQQFRIAYMEVHLPSSQAEARSA